MAAAMATACAVSRNLLGTRVLVTLGGGRTVVPLSPDEADRMADALRETAQRIRRQQAATELTTRELAAAAGLAPPPVASCPSVGDNVSDDADGEARDADEPYAATRLGRGDDDGRH